LLVAGVAATLAVDLVLELFDAMKPRRQRRSMRAPER